MNELAEQHSTEFATARPREYYAPPGCEATPKPLAELRDSVRTGLNVTDARLRFYMDVYWRWAQARGRPDIFWRHAHKIVAIAQGVINGYR